jgi:outer membrane protein insertion porin family
MRCWLLAAMLLVLQSTLCATALWAQDEAQLIEAVEVQGNDYIPKEGILDEVKDILKPGEAFTDQRAKAARDALMAMDYFDDVQITTRASAQGVTVAITVVEKQRIQRILFVGNTVVDDTALTDVIYTRVGHVVDDRTIRRDVRRIEDFYGQKGFIAHVSKASVGQFGVLTFVVEEARIEDVLIEGLKRTKEDVVRRELTIEPGALFEERKIADDIRKIINLGIFQTVTSDIRPGVKDPEQGIILVIVIEEKRTGSASVAAGYSSVDSFVLTLAVAENNFRGRGERASVSMELFGRTSFEVSYFVPYIDRKGSSVSAKVYDTQRTRQFVGGAAVTTSSDTFEERRKGWSLAFSRPLDKRTRGSIRFRSEQIASSESKDTRSLGPGMLTQSSTTSGGNSGTDAEVPPDNPDLDPDVPEPGDVLGPVVIAAPLHPAGTLNSVTFGWTKDTRDLIADATRGSMSALNWEEAGGLFGGEVRFRKLFGEYRFVKQLSNKRDRIAARLLAGTSSGQVPLYESYSAGGGSTLRGYQEDRFRGLDMLILQTEFRRPVTESLTAVLFVDAGDAYGGSFKTSVPGYTILADDADFSLHVGYGVGLRVQTPVGPIRLDFGWGEYGAETHFNFGNTF